MRLAFYKGGRGFFSRLIQTFTYSPFSHVELLIWDESDMSFSSDEKDGGTRFKRLDTSDPSWIIVHVPSTPMQRAQALVYARGKNGLKYDWWGILGITFHINAQHDANDRFCSEICTEILQHSLGWWPGIKPWTVSPGELYQLTNIQINQNKQ
jgi:hypothetical protein